MQLKGLHRNIYKLYSYARTQECLEMYRKIYAEGVSKWEKLSEKKVSLKLKKNRRVYLDRLIFGIRKLLKTWKKE